MAIRSDPPAGDPAVRTGLVDRHVTLSRTQFQWALRRMGELGYGHRQFSRFVQDLIRREMREVAK